MIVSECLDLRAVSGRILVRSTRFSTIAPREVGLWLQTCPYRVDRAVMDQPPHSTSLPKPQVVVRAEEEVDGGWLYELEVTCNAQTTHHTVLLGWRDHDYWSGGAVAPSRVVTSLIEYALARVAMQLPANFDAGRVRRMVPQVDQELRWAI